MSYHGLRKVSFRTTKETKRNETNSKVVAIKETQLSPTIDVHDKNVKLKRTLKWSREGNKVKIAIRFRGRQLAHMGSWTEVMDDFVAECAEVG